MSTDEVRLFHASSELYQVPSVLPLLTGPSTFQNRQVAAGNGWVEEAIELLRPKDRHPRTSVRWAFAEPATAAAYYESQARRYGHAKTLLPAGHLYRVEFTGSIELGPYTLVQLIFDSEGRQPLMDQLIGEYWNPVHSYEVLEYFGPMMRIVEEVDWPGGWAVIQAREAIAADRQAAKKAFRVP